VELKTLQKQELNRTIAIVLGTRPEIIKLAPVIRAMQKSRTPFFLIHTGQHYSMKMDGRFFLDLGLPRPQYSNRNFSRQHRGLSHGQQTAEILRFVEKILLKEKPGFVIVEGDTNTVLGAALVARKLGIGVAHVEAGLRSKDWRMPEEHNRVLTDHISDLLFAPTAIAAGNLRKESVVGKIHIVGNTIVDAVLQNRRRAIHRQILRRLGLSRKAGFFLCTVHREENVDNRENVRRLREVLQTIDKRFGYPVAFIMHPRTKHRLELFGEMAALKKISNLRLAEPVGYLDFLCLLSTCSLALTDSGGVQEEACILRVPCVTLRESTERPETVRAGGNIVAGIEPPAVVRAIATMLKRGRHWRNPFGDGHASDRIVRAIRSAMNM